MPLRTVKSNIVQSIRAFRVSDLQEAALELGHHFLYANLAQAQSKQDVLDLIAQQFTFPAQTSKNFDALYDGMTDPLHKSGQQPGFIVVLEHIPAHAKFDKEAREQLLDVFREASDFWSDRKVSSAMVSMEKVLSTAEQEAQIDRKVWHRDQSDEAQLKKLLEDHHKWTGSQRARELLDNWASARAKFVKVFPNEYKRALAEINAKKAAKAAKPVAA